MYNGIKNLWLMLQYVYKTEIESHLSQKEDLKLLKVCVDEVHSLCILLNCIESLVQFCLLLKNYLIMDRVPGTLTKPYEDSVSNLIWIKVVGIGSANVGKTCLIKHFCESKFNSGYQPTVGVDYGFKVQEMQGVDLRVHLWDLSGSSEFFDVRNELYSGTDAIFLVYDVTNTASFESLDQWLREVTRYAAGNPEIFIVGNKMDLKQKRAVTSAEGRKYAQQNKHRFFETSAANGEGVNDMFEALLLSVFDKHRTVDRKPCGGVRREDNASEIYQKQAV